MTARTNWLIQSGSGIDPFPRRKDLTFLAIKSALGAAAPVLWHDQSGVDGKDFGVRMLQADREPPLPPPDLYHGSAVSSESGRARAIGGETHRAKPH